MSSSFPGCNYAALSYWLLRPSPGILSQDTQSGFLDKHRLIVLHDLDDQGPGRTCVFSKDDISMLSMSRSHQGRGRLLFARGFLSPSWVAEIGSTYRIDPEFFCRHLDFFDSSVHRTCFNMPSLLNTTNNIMHIHINTILTDAMPYSTANLYDNSVHHRASIQEQMSTYKRSLQNSAGCGDSIVRDYSILSDRYSVIEQRISICVAENGDGWTGKLVKAS